MHILIPAVTVFLFFFLTYFVILPIQVVDNKTNKFRHVILEILHRLPNNEILKPYVQELLLLVMNVVDVDNEDNAIQGLRVVFDLQKNYRPQLESEVPRFLQVEDRVSLMLDWKPLKIISFLLVIHRGTGIYVFPEEY